MKSKPTKEVLIIGEMHPSKDDIENGDAFGTSTSKQEIDVIRKYMPGVIFLEEDYGRSDLAKISKELNIDIRKRNEVSYRGPGPYNGDLEGYQQHVADELAKSIRGYKKSLAIIGAKHIPYASDILSNNGNYSVHWIKLIDSDSEDFFVNLIYGEDSSQ